MLQLINLFKPAARQESQSVLADTTLYKVMTQTDSYCGRITYQDDMVICLKVADKSVKILKVNIVRVNIL